ncbi:hypothetical protein GBAR_LOCUS27810, partial [Geodia barretti]
MGPIWEMEVRKFPWTCGDQQSVCRYTLPDHVLYCSMIVGCFVSTRNWWASLNCRFGYWCFKGTPNGGTGLFSGPRKGMASPSVAVWVVRWLQTNSQESS